MTKVMVYVLSVTLLLFLGVILLKNGTTSGKHSQFLLTDVSAFQISTKTMTDLHVLSEKYAIDFSEMLTLYSVENNFFPVKTVAPTTAELEQNFIRNYDQMKDRHKEKDIEAFKLMFDSILKEMVYFPIPLHFDLEETPTYMYGDSWPISKKKVGSQVLFEGTDIYDRENMQGRIPVVSVSSGRIATLGWTAAGGYELTVETDSGAQFFYAHLNGYAEGLSKGTILKAGQLLGFMGNTGFGEKEGNKGQELVHLHFAIGSKTTFTKEKFWINPHPFLRLKENSKVDFKPAS